MSLSKRHLVGSLALLLAVAIGIGYFVEFVTIDVPQATLRLQIHQQIISGTAPSPYRYRVLVPYVYEAVRHLFHHVSDADTLTIASMFVDPIMVWLSLVGLYLFFASLWSQDRALIGALLAAGLMIIPLRNHYYQPWSLIEPGILAIALLAIRRRWMGVLIATLVVATLTRETAALIVVAYAAVGFGAIRARSGAIDWAEVGRLAMRTGALALIWAAIFFGLRFVLGSAAPLETVAGLWSVNTQFLNLSAISVVLFLGPIWVLVIAGWRYAPRFVKWAAVIIPFYLVMFLVFGRWYETRVLMPLYAILIPLALSWMWKGEAEPTA